MLLSTFPCTKLSMRNVDANIGYVLGLLLHGKVVVEFGRKCNSSLIVSYKPLNMVKISITERAQSLKET